MTLEQFDSSVSQCRVKILASEVSPDEIQGVIDTMKKCGNAKRAAAAAAKAAAEEAAKLEAAKLEAAKEPPVEEPVI